MELVRRGGTELKGMYINTEGKCCGRDLVGNQGAFEGVRG